MFYVKLLLWLLGYVAIIVVVACVELDTLSAGVRWGLVALTMFWSMLFFFIGGGDNDYDPPKWGGGGSDVTGLGIGI